MVEIPRQRDYQYQKSKAYGTEDTGWGRGLLAVFAQL